MTAPQRAELSRLRELVDLERQEERRLHLEVIQSMPLVKRVAKGFSWYPLQVQSTGYAIGERPFVVVSREGEEAHQFRAGTAVNLFTTQKHVRSPQKSGVIQYVKRDRMKIILGGNDLPDWLHSGGIGVDLMFDERTYVEMDKALVRLEEAENGKLKELRDVLMGVRPAEFGTLSEKALDHLAVELNDSQLEAVDEILTAKHAALVHGPPGTGKTTTLVAAVGELVKHEKSILFCAPSNSAADLVTLRLAARNINVVRTGNISRVEDDVMRHTLDIQIADHPDTKQVKKLRLEAAEIRRKAKRSRGRDKGLLFRDAGQLSNWAKQLEDHLLEYVLDSAEVIVCTLVGAASSVLSDRKFRTCIIDEAAQALEPASWIPISKANRVVLAGDPFQLPPTVKSREAERGGLSLTLLEKALTRIGRNALLQVQYRMNERIMGFSNDYFYNGRLRAAEFVAKQTLPTVPLSESVVFIDTAGTGFEEKLHPQFKSRYNDGEVDLLIEHLILLKGSTPPEFTLPSIAVITPYREQAVRAEERFDEETRLADLDITVGTVDGFQGRERDVVYVSLVRSNSKGEIGFLADYRRMNVALTRARKQLVVIGDSATVGNDEFFAGFLSYVERRGTYQTAWEYMS